MRKLSLMASALTVLLLASTSIAQLRVANIFSDNMVVQRDAEISIWGWAKPGKRVSVTVQNDEIASTDVDENGRWKIDMSPVKGGPEPFSIVVESDREKVEFANVVAGDVWVCSGQSNMEWTVKDSGNWDEERVNANYPLIRHVKIDRLTSSFPKDDAKNGGWQSCTPGTVGKFTAVGYFFGRELHRELDIPIGLINTSWGGTIIEAWISGESLKTHADFASVVEKIEALPRNESANRKLQEKLQKWSEDLSAATQDRSDKWQQANLNDTDWKQISAPGHWEYHGYPDVDGVAWYRRTIDIPASWSGKELQLSLAKIDDMDETYVNGTKVGGENNWDADRNYSVDRQLVKPGPMSIAIRVTDENLGGGIYGSPDSMFASVEGEKPISLAGPWKFKLSTKTRVLGPKPNNGFAGPNQPTVLHNAMVHPLHPFRFKGVIWYQGESNAGRAFQYRSLMKLLIEDWRDKWSNEFPFYWVQLANFTPASDSPGDSKWAELREAQSMALSLEQTGQAVTIDIGDANDIHPKNKQEVGRRLALNALAKDYGKKIEFSGPVFRSSKSDNNRIRLSFDHAAGLHARGEKLQRFEIAGADKKFVWADASIDGDEVIVSSPEISRPVAVRYAWADNPEGCNLYNGAGLPASPFRTDNWKGVTQQ